LHPGLLADPFCRQIELNWSRKEFEIGSFLPQGLKPSVYGRLRGTAEAVSFPKRFVLQSIAVQLPKS
jgi:hypothetical protein